MNTLNLDLIIEIIKKLDFVSISNLAKTCSTYNTYCKNDIFWKNHVTKDFKILSNTWLSVYQFCNRKIYSSAVKDSLEKIHIEHFQTSIEAAMYLISFCIPKIYYSININDVRTDDLSLEFLHHINSKHILHLTLPPLPPPSPPPITSIPTLSTLSYFHSSLPHAYSLPKMNSSSSSNIITEDIIYKPQALVFKEQSKILKERRKEQSRILKQRCKDLAISKLCSGFSLTNFWHNEEYYILVQCVTPFTSFNN